MLAGKVPSTPILYNALNSSFPVCRVILEESVSRRAYLRKRVKRLGFKKVIGQLMFKTLIVPILQAISRSRVVQIKEENKMDERPIDASIVVGVESVNSESTISLLQDMDPDVVVVNGTRIISPRVLGCIEAQFLNLHAGITPMYRGVHGAYWALVENNRSACGCTVYFVDPGIDSGEIYRQAAIHPGKRDNFVTYPWLQLAAGIPLIIEAVDDVLNDRATTMPNPLGESKLRTHPTLFEYLQHRVRGGVR